MTEPRTIQQQLEAERIAISALTDTTEQALAQAALRLKLSAMKGEKGASQELAKATKALDDYREKQTIGAIYATAGLAIQYLNRQGYQVSTGKFSMDKNSGLIGTVQHNGKRVFTQKVLDGYARAHLARQIPDKDTTQEDYKTGIQRETERKLKIKNDEEEGRLIRLEDETRRRVQVIVGLKIALENQRTTFMQILSERMRANGQLQTENIEDPLEWQRQAVDALVLEAGHIYSNAVLQVFSEIGKQGGIECE